MKETSKKLEQQTLWDISTSTCSQVSEHFRSAWPEQDTQAQSEPCQRAFPVNPSHSPVIAKERQTSGIFGHKSSESFANLDPGASFWKMSLGCFQQTKGKRWEQFLQTWPRGFLVVAEEGLRAFAYELQTLGRRISEKESFLWPTPIARDYKRPGLNSSQLHLSNAVRLWPTPAAQDGKNGSLPPSQESRDTLPGEVLRQVWRTPQAHDAKSGQIQKGYTTDLTHQVQGKLNPEFVEVLMGFPIGWTDLTDGLQDLESDNTNGNLPEQLPNGNPIEQSA